MRYYQSPIYSCVGNLVVVYWLRQLSSQVEGLYRRAHCSFELYAMSLAHRCKVTLLFPESPLYLLARSSLRACRFKRYLTLRLDAVRPRPVLQVIIHLYCIHEFKSLVLSSPASQVR